MGLCFHKQCQVCTLEEAGSGFGASSGLLEKVPPSGKWLKLGTLFKDELLMFFLFFPLVKSPIVLSSVYSCTAVSNSPNYW